MGRVSPGDEVAAPAGSGVIWRGERYVLMLAARFIDFPRRAARTTPFIIYIFRQVAAGGSVVIFSVSPATSWKHD